MIMKISRLIIVSVILFIAANQLAGAQTKYSDIFEYIRGKVPGVQVGQSGPGEMPSIIIRGIGTNSEHTQPLFIVDGVQTDNISTIDPENIYQIDVIKDGTSAIYGMQGANGVIVVTTKGAMMAAEAEAEAKKAARLAKKEARKNK